MPRACSSLLIVTARPPSWLGQRKRLLRCSRVTNGTHVAGWRQECLLSPVVTLTKPQTPGAEGSQAGHTQGTQCLGPARPVALGFCSDNPWPCDANIPSAALQGPYSPAWPGQDPQRLSQVRAEPHLWGRDEGVGLGVCVIAACEVPVVGGDDGVLLPLLDVLPARSEGTQLGTSGFVTWPDLPSSWQRRGNGKRPRNGHLPPGLNSHPQSRREPQASLRFVRSHT